MKKNINTKVLSTYARHMICPSFFYKITEDNNIEHEGLKEFYNYRYNFSKYKGDSEYSIDNLLEKISNAVIKTFDKSKKPIILLSDGKDSLSIAVAFSKLGIKCKTLTLLRNDDQQMKTFIGKTCSKLGHEAFFVTVDDIIQNFNKDLFIESFKEMEYPVLDQAYLFFLFGMNTFFKKTNLNPSDCQFFDGMGNDEYLGYFFSNEQLLSYKVSMFGLWKLLPNNLFKLKWYFRSPIESHGDLSSLSTFFKISGGYDLNRFFKKIKKGSKEDNYLNFRAFSRGKFLDNQCMIGKTKNSSLYLNSVCIFPWLDKELADYCFNLPKQKKYNFKKRVNKIALRELLKEKIDWNQEKRGVDLYFDLNLKSLKEDIVDKVVPSSLSEKILKNNYVKDHVKVRALLELMNFYSYCKVNNLSDSKIKEILEE